jgi:hypothetical protein
VTIGVHSELVCSGREAQPTQVRSASRHISAKPGAGIALQKLDGSVLPLRTNLSPLMRFVGLEWLEARPFQGMDSMFARTAPMLPLGWP